jgi:hypothetical protein
VVTAAEGWHPGVVGLVAARLKEKFGRPAFAIALEPGGIGTGSGRSIPGVDIGRAVRRAVAEALSGKGRRPRHGGRRDAAQGALRRCAPFSKRRSAPTWRPRGARAVSDRRRRKRRGGQRRSRRHDRTRRAVRLRQSGAGDRAAGAYVPMPKKSARRTCACGSNPPTAPASMPSPSAPRGQKLGAVPHHRHRVGGAVCRASALCNRADAQSRGRQTCVHAAGSLRRRLDRWQGEERVQFCSSPTSRRGRNHEPFPATVVGPAEIPAQSGHVAFKVCNGAS